MELDDDFQRIYFEWWNCFNCIRKRESINQMAREKKRMESEKGNKKWGPDGNEWSDLWADGREWRTMGGDAIEIMDPWTILR